MPHLFISIHLYFQTFAVRKQGVRREEARRHRHIVTVVINTPAGNHEPIGHIWGKLFHTGDLL